MGDPCSPALPGPSLPSPALAEQPAQQARGAEGSSVNDLFRRALERFINGHWVFFVLLLG